MRFWWLINYWLSIAVAACIFVSNIRAQVVGWPPVRSYRKNILAVNNSDKAISKEDGEKSGINNSAALVKVCMDGAPYLRKVDLKMYKSYQDLCVALDKMFSSFTSGNCLIKH